MAFLLFYRAAAAAKEYGALQGLCDPDTGMEDHAGSMDFKGCKSACDKRTGCTAFGRVNTKKDSWCKTYTVDPKTAKGKRGDTDNVCWVQKVKTPAPITAPAPAPITAPKPTTAPKPDVTPAPGLATGDKAAAWESLFRDVQLLITDRAVFSDGSSNFLDKCSARDWSKQQITRRRRSRKICKGPCDNSARALSAALAYMFAAVTVKAAELTENKVITAGDLASATESLGLLEVMPILKAQRRRAGPWEAAKTLLGEHLFDIFQNGDMTGAWKKSGKTVEGLADEAKDKAEGMLNSALCTIVKSAVEKSNNGKISAKYVYHALDELYPTALAEVAKTAGADFVSKYKANKKRSRNSRRHKRHRGSLSW